MIHTILATIALSTTFASAVVMDPPDLRPADAAPAIKPRPALDIAIQRHAAMRRIPQIERATIEGDTIRYEYADGSVATLPRRQVTMRPAVRDDVELAKARANLYQSALTAAGLETTAPAHEKIAATDALTREAQTSDTLAVAIGAALGLAAGAAGGAALGKGTGKSLP